MAEGFNPINYVGFQDPATALKLQQQQALAAQLMAESAPRTDINTPVGTGPYARVSAYSPLEGLSKGVEKGVGAYLQNQTNERLADALGGPKVQSAEQSPDGMPGGTLLPWQDKDKAARMGSLLQSGQASTSAPTIQERMAEAMQPGMGKAMLEARLKNQYAGPTKEAEERKSFHVTPQGTYETGDQILGAGNPASSPAAPSVAPASPVSPGNAQKMIDVFDPGSAAPADKPAASMAADGKPLLPNLTAIPKPDPSGTPKFNTENTKTGVEQTIQDQKDAAEGNKAFAATSQSLSQEKARLDNLIQVYKDVQSGTLTAQNPELFNKLQALGFKDDPASLHDLAGIQNATQNHILQVIQQIKDTNANAGGGAATRTFGSEISQLLENGESAKAQPEALWNVIGQAKGLVDHHLDMVSGWNSVGGLGNRLAGGYTMRPDDYATKFTASHNIADYRDKALKDMGPFKGMAGNNGTSPNVPQIGFISKGHKFLGGDPSKPESWGKVP
jgi:hypothetical protein